MMLECVGLSSLGFSVQENSFWYILSGVSLQVEVESVRWVS